MIIKLTPIRILIRHAVVQQSIFNQIHFSPSHQTHGEDRIRPTDRSPKNGHRTNHAGRVTQAAKKRGLYQASESSSETGLSPGFSQLGDLGLKTGDSPVSARGNVPRLVQSPFFSAVA